MTSHPDDDATTASADSFSNEIIDVTKSPAAIYWLDRNGHHQSLSHSPLTHDHVTLDIKFDAESNTALFKVSINVSLKGKRNKSNIFLFIQPEHIQSLSIGSDSEDGHISAAEKLGSAVHMLNFILSAPAMLVIPGDGCVAKNEATRSILSLLQDLAEKTHFTVAFPTRLLSKDRLATVCDDISSQGRVTTMSSLVNMSKLYGGKGGRVVRQGDKLETESRALAETTSHRLSITDPSAEGSSQKNNQKPKSDKHQQGQGEDAGSPPSYDELETDQSLPGYPRFGSKRRRLGSDASQYTGKESLRLEEICRRGFSEISGRLDHIEQSLGTLGSRLDRVEERMFAIESQLSRSRSSEQNDRPSNELDSRVGEIEERMDNVEQKLDASLSELATDVENQIYDVRHEFDNMISVRVGDEIGVAQTELEDFVKDEMVNVTEDVEQAIREKLRDALA